LLGFHIEEACKRAIRKEMSTKTKSSVMSDFRFWTTTGLLTAGGILGGLTAGFQPDGAGWRFFSYHPLLVCIHHEVFIK